MEHRYTLFARADGRTVWTSQFSSGLDAIDAGYKWITEPHTGSRSYEVTTEPINTTMPPRS